MSVGTNIKNRRYELRMSQQELAELMGYKTRSTIAKIESGENDVSQKKLQKFAVALDTTVEMLLFGQREPVPRTVNVPVLLSSQRNKNVAIILAGGKTGSNRQNLPTQYVNVNGKPIIVYSMDAYQAHPSVDDIYVVCTKGWENIVRAYADQYGISKLREVVLAGSSGITSLKNAVDHIKNIYSPDDYIFIQESTRPMVTTETISNLLQECYERGSATMCHSMGEYVQFNVSNQKAEYLDRNAIIALQSPEAHRLSLVCDVFEKSSKMNHTLTESCFAMLMYNLGYEINFINSSINNIKIAREEDVAALSTMVKQRQTL